MTPELWHRLKPLYDTAAGIPASEREQFIAASCGSDTALKDALRSLLQSAGDPTRSLHTPAGEHQDPFPPGKTFAAGDLILNRFRIVRLLGAGGMGEVYEANDLELGRIALKTIRPAITSDPESLARFRKEVQLARRVTNPHVCRIHEFFLVDDPAGGSRRAFLTMEFLEGITLAEKIRQSGPTPWPEARIVARQLCSGLAGIHEAGIIHRDVKCRNIMLAARHGKPCVVLMDFGVAGEVLLPDETAATALTHSRAVVGTPRYMAPEQAQGLQVGPPADIYALGIVLHELVTGKHPADVTATGRSASATSSKGPLPRLPSSIQPGLPRRCDALIAKCLEPDPQRRYQSIAELERALNRVSSLTRLGRQWPQVLAAMAALVILGTLLLLIPPIGERARGILFASPEKHIVVLPFHVDGTNAETIALGDGLMDSLAGKLSNLRAANQALWVVPASVVRDRKVHDPADALRQFGATLVVEGSFSRDGQSSSLRLNLIDPRKTREIGFVDVVNQEGDLASLQDDAVTRLARLMNVSANPKLVPPTPQPIAHSAYEDYLTGLGYFQRYDKPGNLHLAIAALSDAIRADPKFAPAYAHLAQVSIMQYRMNGNPQDLQLAQQNAQRAIQLDDRDPSTYVALAQSHDLTGRHDLAVREFQRAIQLDPLNAEAFAGMANAYYREGRIADAEAAYLRAAAIRPDDWTGYNSLGGFYDSIGRSLDAIAQFRRALALTPDNYGLYINLGVAYMDLADPASLAKAEEALQQSVAINPTYIAWADLGFLYLQEHRFQESIAASQKARQFNPNSADIWENLAAAWDWLKDNQNAATARARAIDLLRQAVKLNPQDEDSQATLAALVARNGDKDEALERIRISLALSPNSQYVLSQVADAYELLGDRRKAVRYLISAISNGLPMPQLRADPEIQGVLADPRFLTFAVTQPGPHQ
ncbi:MAG: tetratricopeptide repeat protein [Acidobacteriaceae bacterium]